jgi:hypothetical protein
MYLYIYTYMNTVYIIYEHVYIMYVHMVSYFSIHQRVGMRNVYG